MTMEPVRAPILPWLWAGVLCRFRFLNHQVARPSFDGFPRHGSPNMQQTQCLVARWDDEVVNRGKIFLVPPPNNAAHPPPNNAFPI